VSPFGSLIPPQLNVCFRNRRLLPSYAPRGANISPIISTLRILPVATGVSGQRTPRHSSLTTRHCSFVFITLQIPFPATPLFSHPYKTPGVSPSVSLCLCLPRPGRRGKSHVFSSLPPLEISWLSFCNSRRLFSIACSLFYENTRGWGGVAVAAWGLAPRCDRQSIDAGRWVSPAG
jgi:hypothetical protein